METEVQNLVAKYSADISDLADGMSEAGSLIADMGSAVVDVGKEIADTSILPDISGLQQGTAEAQEAITALGETVKETSEQIGETQVTPDYSAFTKETEELPKKIDKVTKASNISAGQVKKGFNQAAQGVKLLGFALVGSKNEAVAFAGSTIANFGFLAAEVSSFATGPLAKVLVALAAIGAISFVSTKESFQDFAFQVGTFAKEGTASAIRGIEAILNSAFGPGKSGKGFEDSNAGRFADQLEKEVGLEKEAIKAVDARIDQGKRYKEAINKVAEAWVEHNAILKFLDDAERAYTGTVKAHEDAILALAKIGTPAAIKTANELAESLKFQRGELEKLTEANKEAERVKSEGKARKQKAQAFKSELSPGTLGIADALLPEDQIATLTDRQTQVREDFVSWVDGLQVTTEDWLTFTKGIFSQFASGVGDSFAQIAVYGADFKETFAALGKDLLASVISFIGELITQWLIYEAFRLAGIETEVVAHAAGQASMQASTAATTTAEVVSWLAAHAQKIFMWGVEAVTFIAKNVSHVASTIWATTIEVISWLIAHSEKLAMWAVELAAFISKAISEIYLAIVAAYSSLGPIGWLIGIGVAAGAVAAVLATVGAFAGGGIVTGPTMALIGEGRETEYVLPQSKLDAMVQHGGAGGSQTIGVYLDSKLITRAVVRGMPSEIRMHGIKGL